MHKIWMIGMHDLSNYGDCMFPHIFAYKMRGVGCSIEYVSLTGSKSIFSDAVRSISIEEAETRIQAGDTVIVGGGNIITDVPMTFFESRDIPYRAIHNGADLWLRCLELAQERNCKSIIAGAGAFAPLKKATLQRWERVKETVDYIAWRDRSTWQIMGKRKEELVRPDMAVDKDILKIFMGNRAIDKEDKILVNLRPRSLNGANAKKAKKALEDLETNWGLPIVFHSNSYSHNDSEMYKLLGIKRKGEWPRTEKPKTIRESFRSIVNSRLVVTSSMHTYITAVAANNPVILITLPRYNKFKGVYEIFQCQGYITSSWDDIGMVNEGKEGIRGQLGDEMRSQEEHWERVRMVVRK